MAEKITVALELDGRKYTAELDRAKASTANFSSAAKSEIGSTATAFNNLDKNVGVITRSFNKLRSVLLGAAFVGLARSSLALANEIYDLSNATSLAVDDIIRFREAMMTSGGSAEDSSRALLTLYQNIDQAAQGSKSAQEAFARVGVGLDELATMSERDILRTVIENFKNLPDQASRAAVAAELLGKTFRGITIDDEFIRTLEDGTQKTDQQAAAIKRAAELNDQFAKTWADLRIAFLEAFDPFIKYIGTIIKSMPSLITLFKILGAVIVATFVASGLRSMISLVALLGRGVLAVVNGVKNLGTLLSGFKEAGSVGKFLRGTGPKTGLGKTRDAASAIGFAGGAAVGASILFGNEEAQKSYEDLAANAAGNLDKIATGTRAVKDANAELLKSIQDIGDEYENNAEKTLNAARAEGVMLTMTDEQKEKYKASQKIMEDFDQVVQKLNEKRVAGNQKVNKAIDEEIEALLGRTNVELQALDQILTANQAIEKSIKEQKAANEAIYDMVQKTKDIQDSYALDTLVGIEKQIKQIEIAEQKAADAAIFRVQQETMNLPEGERAKRIQEETDKILANQKRSVEMQSEAARRGYEESRKWSTGWNKAMKEYVENATNAAKRAEDVFTKATQGMEDAIVQFAKTGKFEWKSFVSSIAEELLRQQIRELIAKTFGGMSQPASGGGGGGGGLFGVIGSLLGFANGGTVPTNGPVLVGERGPELLMNARGTQVVPNSALGGTNVVYNINAVDAASFKQLVAQDPSFIYAVSQQGAKSIPSTRR